MPTNILEVIMKKLIVIFLLTACLLSGCKSAQAVDIVTTTLPVFEFTAALCQGTDLQVGRLVTENVSCLHDYTLQTSQMRMVESADTIVISGAGLEDFLGDVLSGSENVVDASEGVHLHSGYDHGHGHEDDPHIWLSPALAMEMAESICSGLSAVYPQYSQLFHKNLAALLEQLETLQAYGQQSLAELSTRELITFHDGFSYFAESFHLTILKAVEEESGSEASAGELKELIQLVGSHQLPGIFIEENGSASAADVIHAETGVDIYTLDMAMAGNSYFEAMYHNIDTVKEALG